MKSRREEIWVKTEHMIDEKFTEIFFLTKERLQISGNTVMEAELYETINKYRIEIKNYGNKNKY